MKWIIGILLIMCNFVSAQEQPPLQLSTPQQQSFLMKLTPITIDTLGSIDWVATSLLTTYNVLNLTDVFLTRRGIEGGATEGNPLMSGLSPPWDLVVKVSATMGVNYIFKEIYMRDKTAAYIFGAVIVVVSALVDIHNYRIVMSF